LEKYSLCNLQAWHKQALTLIKVSKNRICPASTQFQQTSTIRSYFNPVSTPDHCIPVKHSDSAANNETVVIIELSQ